MTQLQRHEATSTPAPMFSTEQVDIIKNNIAKGASDADLKLFLNTCQSTGLSPFKKQIYFFKTGGGFNTIVGIDGYRAIAESSGRYAGNSSPTFELKEDGNLDSATVTVSKFLQNGAVGTFSAVAFWDEYKGATPIWKKMPRTMLAKCAEALALRKAFPERLSGLYTEEEFHQAGFAADTNADNDKVGHHHLDKLPQSKELYAGTEAQKKLANILMDAAEIGTSSKKECSAALKGVPMEYLEEAVNSWAIQHPTHPQQP